MGWVRDKQTGVLMWVGDGLSKRVESLEKEIKDLKGKIEKIEEFVNSVDVLIGYLEKKVEGEEE